MSSPTDMIEVSTLADTSHVFIPGQTTSTFQIAGPLDVDPTANGQADAVADIKANSTTATPITYFPLGTTDGGGWLLEAWATELTTESPLAGSTDWSLSAQTSGATDMAGVLLSSAAVTVDTNGASVDNGAATTNGGVAHLHVTGFTGLTSDAIIIQHSSTGAFSGEQTTLVTFTTATGQTSQRVEVSGTVNRYLRVVDDVTGTGTCTRVVAFSRR